MESKQTQQRFPTELISKILIEAADSTISDYLAAPKTVESQKDLHATSRAKMKKAVSAIAIVSKDHLEDIRNVIDRELTRLSAQILVVQDEDTDARREFDNAISSKDRLSVRLAVNRVHELDGAWVDLTTVVQNLKAVRQNLGRVNGSRSVSWMQPTNWYGGGDSFPSLSVGSGYGQNSFVGNDLGSWRLS